MKNIFLFFISICCYAQSSISVHSILFTTSKDGIVWEKDPTIIIENGYSPSATVKDGKIFLYYLSDKLSLITSDDTAKSFKRNNVKLYRISDKDIQDICIRYYDNSFKLFFITSDSLGNSLRLAYSFDGINFFEDSHVLFTEKGIHKPDVVIINHKPIIYLTSGGDLIRIITYDGKYYLKDTTFYFPSAVYSSSIAENTFIRTYYTGDYSINSFKFEKNMIKKEGIIYQDQKIYISEPAIIKYSDSLYFMFYKKILPNDYIDTCGCIKKIEFN